MDENRSNHSEHLEKARDSRRTGQLEEAGEWYSMAAYADLADGIPGNSSAGELRHFIEAAVCYRIAGKRERGKNRCEMGILRAEDMRERYHSSPPPEYGPDHAERALWDEFIADLRVVGELDGSIEAYDRAREIYRNADDPIAAFVDSHYTLNGVFGSLVAAAGLDIEEYDDVWERGTCTEWSKFRQQYLPVAMDRLIDQGEWPIPEIPDDEDR